MKVEHSCSGAIEGAWLSSSCFELIFLSKEVEIQMFAQHTQKLLFRPGWNTLWISVNLHTQLCQDWVSSVQYRSKNFYAMITMFIESLWPVLIWTSNFLWVWLAKEGNCEHWWHSFWIILGCDEHLILTNFLFQKPKCLQLDTWHVSWNRDAKFLIMP